MSWLSTRMSTYQMNYFLRSGVSRATVDLQRAGQELATGRRADMFADLGPRAGVAITMRSREESTQSYLEANSVLEHKLDATLLAIEAIREPIQDVLQSAIVNQESAGSASFAVQAEARSALESVLSTLNNSFNGDYLFSGTSSNVRAVQRWDATNADTGLSPEDVMASVIGTGPTDTASVAAIVAELDEVFFTGHSNANFDFEATFYNGTPELDAFGNPNVRVSGRLDEGQQLVYGIQANDDGFRHALKGLAMLATFDIQNITDEDAYEAWMDQAVQALSLGVQGTLDESANLGFNQQLVETAKERLEDLSIVQVRQIATYENVDPYQVATEIQGLETQLQASYSVSSRLSGLTILDWYR